MTIAQCPAYSRHLTYICWTVWVSIYIFFTCKRIYSPIFISLLKELFTNIIIKSEPTYWDVSNSLKVRESIFIISMLLLLLSRFSRVWLCATPYTASHQAPPSLGFSRQEHWSGLPFPSPMHESEKWKVKSLSRVWLFATPWTAAYQASPPMGFSKLEYWSGVPLPSPIMSILPF